MKKYIVIILAIFGALFLSLLALSGIESIANKKRYFTKTTIEILPSPLYSSKQESVELQALKILKEELSKFKPLYARKVKYYRGDTGLLFYGYNSNSNSDTLLFKIVNNKNRATNRMLRQLGASGGEEETFDLSIFIDSEYYTIKWVNFNKLQKGGYLIESGLMMPDFKIEIAR